MKKVLFSAALLMAAATVSFAGNPKGETKAETPTEAKSESTSGLTTYYAIKNSPGSPQPFRWTSNATEVSGLECDELSGGTCVIQAASQPADGTVPSGTPVTNEVYQ